MYTSDPPDETSRSGTPPLGIHTDLPCALQGHPTLTATELREKLLREKVKALRKSSTTQKELEVDGG